MKKQFYTKQEVAEILGVHSKTVERYLLSGKLKGARFGKAWRISQEDIDDLYNSTKQETEKMIKNKNEE